MTNFGVFILSCLTPAILSQGTVSTTLSIEPFHENTSNITTTIPKSRVDFTVERVLEFCSINDVTTMVRHCRKSDVMCKHTGCGERGYSEDMDLSCFCDHRCIVYGDCCYDFYDSCKEEVERSKVFSYLEGVSVRCLDRPYLSVVDGCALEENVNDYNRTPNNGDDNDEEEDDVMLTENGEQTHRKQRQEVVEKRKNFQEEDDFLHTLTFIVTDDFTGIHFVNYSIYKCNRLKQSRPMFWSQKRGGSNVNTTDKENLPVPPSNTRGRNCPSKIYSMFCLDAESDYFICNEGIYEPELFCIELDKHVSINSTNDNAHDSFCGFRFDWVPKTTDFAFNRLFSVNFDLNVLRITDRLTFRWTIALCLRDEDRIENCQFRKCGSSHYVIGHLCYRLRRLSTMVKYFKAANTTFTQYSLGPVVDYINEAISSANISHAYTEITNLTTTGDELTLTVDYIFDEEALLLEPTSRLHIPFFIALFDDRKLPYFMERSQKDTLDPIEIKACVSFVEINEDGFYRDPFDLTRSGGDYPEDTVITVANNKDKFQQCDSVIFKKKSIQHLGISAKKNLGSKQNVCYLHVLVGCATVQMIMIIYHN